MASGSKKGSKYLLRRYLEPRTSPVRIAPASFVPPCSPAALSWVLLLPCAAGQLRWLRSFRLRAQAPAHASNVTAAVKMCCSPEGHGMSFLESPGSLGKSLSAPLLVPFKRTIQGPANSLRLKRGPGESAEEAWVLRDSSETPRMGCQTTTPSSETKRRLSKLGAGYIRAKKGIGAGTGTRSILTALFGNAGDVCLLFGG